MQQGEHMLVRHDAAQRLAVFPADVKCKLRIGISSKMKDTSDFEYLAAQEIQGIQGIQPTQRGKGCKSW